MSVLPLPDLRVRRRVPELMDDPALPPARLRGALDGIARLNVLAGSARALWPGVEAAARPGAPLRVLDVGCGSGDVLLALVARARRAGIRLDAVGLDDAEVAVDHARDRAARVGLPARFLRRDALADPLPDADVVVSSLFLHHLDGADARDALARMHAAAGSALVVQDLERGRAGWLLALLASRLASRSPVVRTDALRSVRGAFTCDEAARLARSAGLAGVRARRIWPCRWQLLVRRSR